jgi:hypothetical protein
MLAGGQTAWLIAFPGSRLCHQTVLLPPHILPILAAGTYAANFYSNKRWCCGDMDHFDISAWAFEKLADKKWGVIGECAAVSVQG